MNNDMFYKLFIKQLLMFKDIISTTMVPTNVYGSTLRYLLSIINISRNFTISSCIIKHVIVW